MPLLPGGNGGAAAVSSTSRACTSRMRRHVARRQRVSTGCCGMVKRQKLNHDKSVRRMHVVVQRLFTTHAVTEEYGKTSPSRCIAAQKGEKCGSSALASVFKSVKQHRHHTRQ
ncbi:hypothetical protein AVEN_205617-1 [Araneus ventricosus]|uniref:Uncharacterized protein n=1 Tax=Araneus ventricosus TaxID=182803 RepID=A0A4Y2WBC3_ARAVE|nr:hypothetical protein AVEN_205617-1 [Araneus ventricosus]